MSSPWQGYGLRQVAVASSPHLAACMLAVAVVLSGCASQQGASASKLDQRMRLGTHLLSTTNATPGHVYQVGVYIVAKGDTLAKVAQKFQTTPAELLRINPGTDPPRWRVGQRIRVYERKTEPPQAPKSKPPNRSRTGCGRSRSAFRRIAKASDTHFYVLGGEAWRVYE